MELELVYNGRREVLQYHIDNETLVPDGNWTAPEIEIIEEKDASSENKSQSTSASDEDFRHILTDMQICDPQKCEIAVKKLHNLLYIEDEELPTEIDDCLPVVMKILQLEEQHQYIDVNADGKSLKELCLEIMKMVLFLGGWQRFLEEGCLPVVLETFQFLSYTSAIMLWNGILGCILPHLKFKDLENAMPVLEKNIKSGQYVSSSVAYYAYDVLALEFMDDEMVLGKLLNGQVVQNMLDTLKNPIWQNSDTIGEIFNVLAIACEYFPKYTLQLHERNITSTICYVLTNSCDISAGKFFLLERTSFITENILKLIKILIPNDDLNAYYHRKMQELFDGKVRIVIGTDKQELLENDQISEKQKLTNWLKKENEMTFKWIVRLFRLTQEIFLTTKLPTLKQSCMECLQLLFTYDNQAWKPFFNSQDVSEELMQWISVKKFKFSHATLNLVSILLDIAPELCAAQFFQNGLKQQILASIKRNEDEDQIGCFNKEPNSLIIAEELYHLDRVCNNLLPDENNPPYLIDLQAAICNLNTREIADTDSLEVIRQIIQKECIDVYDLQNTGLIRSLLYFLTGVDTNQRSLRTPPSELILSLDDGQKRKRNERIKQFLKIFLGLSADSLHSPAVRPDYEKSFINLLKLLMTSFTAPTIPENATDSYETETDGLEKFSKQNAIDGSNIYRNGPKDVLDEYLVPYLPQYQSTDGLSSEIAALLSVLYGINKYHRCLYTDGSCTPLVSISHFIDRPLSWNIGELVKEAPYNNFTVLPSFVWKIIFACPFLISFEVRLSAIRQYTKMLITNNRLQKMDSIPHLLHDEKPTFVAISRRQIIEETKLYLSSPLVCLNSIKVGFKYEEPEKGPGVQREYYSLISKELQNSKLNMWKSEVIVSHQNTIEEKVTSSYVLVSHGLYPKPSSSDVQLCNFKLLGKLMAKVLVDCEILDLNLHECIYKLLLNNDYNVELSDLASLDPVLGNSMNRLQDLVTKRENLLKQSNIADKPLPQIQDQLSVLKFDGVDVEDLCLNFTLPGYPDIELIDGGMRVNVNLCNLHQYVELVVLWFMKTGVLKQITAIREGFNSFFPTTVLKVFYPEELNKVFCGPVKNQTFLLERWISMCDTHEGYTRESQVVKFLSQIACEYDSSKQQDFLMFVSGFPRLVVDGRDEFANILNISRLPVREGSDPDDYLPRAVTCNTVLMLPDYSSIDIMRKKFDYVLAEARNF